MQNYREIERPEGGEEAMTANLKQRGATGKTGKTGARGAKGPRGPAGPPGKSEMDPNALSAVHDQIDRIHRELQVQLQRMAQLQVEIDDVRNTVKRLMTGS